MCSRLLGDTEFSWLSLIVFVDATQEERNTVSYGEKENGQTADFSNLSALAPQLGLEPRTL